MNHNLHTGISKGIHSDRNSNFSQLSSLHKTYFKIWVQNFISVRSAQYDQLHFKEEGGFGKEEGGGEERLFELTCLMELDNFQRSDL